MAQGMRKLRLESLEHKKMLAGDVLVSVSQGVLEIEGDELGNQIAISSGETPGSVVVGGLAGTNVILVDGDGNPVEPEPGAPDRAVVVEGVRRGIRANMGDGDDVVNVNDLDIRANVSIRTGEGDDTVRVGLRQGGPGGPGELGDEMPEEPVDEGANVSIGRNLRIGTGAGEDTVLVNNTNVRGRLSVAAGSEDDTVRIGRADRPDNEDPPAGETPEGDAEADDVDVRARRGVRISLGAGTDTAGIRDVATSSLRVGGGEGEDTIRVSGVNARHIGLNGGRGDFADAISVRETATRSLFAALGDGDDTLTIGGVQARWALLLGGEGEADTFNDLGDNMIRRQRVLGFELPPVEEDDEGEVPSEVV